MATQKKPLIERPDLWPQGMSLSDDGVYQWTHPKTGDIFRIGGNVSAAISECIEANMKVANQAKSATGVLPVDKSERCRSKIITASVPIDQAWCGVYFLLRRNVIVYVGLSSNVGGRLREHRRDKTKEFDSFSCMPCTKEEAIELEVFYIDKFRPEYNVKDNASAVKKPKYQPTKRERYYRSLA